MTAAQPCTTTANARHRDADTNAVDAPLFLAPPPTDQAVARAAVIAEARAAAGAEPGSPPVLRFSAGG